MLDYNTTRVVHCVVCGQGFFDDCNDVFCSSSCEEEWEYAHAECERCGYECGGDNLEDGLCENCIDELEEEEKENAR